jgi:hypothetical protein
MNLEKFAALRGEAWARRVLRETPSARPPSSESAWPGKIAEARQLAGALGKPRLLERLTKIIQERASTTWRRLIDG